jgi:hypothetical protein
VDAIAVKRDGSGRLVLPKGEAKALQKLAGAPVVIYVQKAPQMTSFVRSLTVLALAAPAAAQDPAPAPANPRAIPAEAPIVGGNAASAKQRHWTTPFARRSSASSRCWSPRPG